MHWQHHEPGGSYTAGNHDAETQSMIPLALFDQALRSSSPVEALRAQVIELSAKGHTKADIYAALEQFMLRLRADGREADENLVLDIMDTLVGWCHPDAQLLPGDDSSVETR
jgi:hypothetical protein